MCKGGHAREEKWTQRIAVGSKFFIEDVKNKLGYKAIGRKVVSAGDVYQLKENKAPYNSNFDGKMSTLRQKNSLYWNVYPEKSGIWLGPTRALKRVLLKAAGRN